METSRRTLLAAAAFVAGAAAVVQVYLYYQSVGGQDVAPDSAAQASRKENKRRSRRKNAKAAVKAAGARQEKPDATQSPAEILRATIAGVHHGSGPRCQILDMDQAQSALLVEAAAKRTRDAGPRRFADQHFPAEASSLRYDWNRNGLGPPPVWVEVVWRRLPSAAAKARRAWRNVTVLSQEISPSSLSLGLLADPAFSSAAALLATKLELVRQLFATQDASALGLYAVRLCKNGSWRTVLVDDAIPYHGTSGGAAFLSSRDGSAWPVLLEKAWAKAHGSYQAAARGFLGDVLRDLTGAPAEPLAWDSTWEGDDQRATAPASLARALEKGWLVGAVARARPAKPDEARAARHLLEGFAYPVTAVRGDRVSVLDPWSADRKGRSDAGSPAPSPGSAILEMSLADFYTEFSSAYACRCDASWAYKSTRADVARGKPAAYELVLPQPASMVVALSHRDRRCGGGGPAALAERYPDLSLTLVRAGSKGEAIAVRSCASARDVWVAPEEVLPAGTYHVVAEAHGDEPGGAAPVLALSVFSSQQVELNHSQSNAVGLLCRALARRAVKSGETTIPLSIKGLSRKVWQGPNGMLVFTWKNTTADLVLKDMVTVQNLTLNGWEIVGLPVQQRSGANAGGAGDAAKAEAEGQGRGERGGAAGGGGEPSTTDGAGGGAQKKDAQAEELVVQRFLVEVGPGKSSACFLRRTSTKNGLTLPDTPAPGNHLAKMCPISSEVYRVPKAGAGEVGPVVAAGGGGTGAVAAATGAAK